MIDLKKDNKQRQVAHVMMYNPCIYYNRGINSMINHTVQASTEQLNNIITENFKLHGNNRITIADLMIGLWLARTVNLNKIVNYSSRATQMKKDDIYRGYQNLIHKFSLTQTQLALGILKMFGLLGDCQIILALDRTNWKYGLEDLNLLVLSVVVNGCGVPLFWLELDSKGNSNTAERNQLMEMFINTFGAQKISYILGDREFIGDDWFSYLDKLQIKFIMRIKSNMQIDTGTPDGVGCSCAVISNAEFTNPNTKLVNYVIYFNKDTNEVKYYSKKEWHIIQVSINDLSTENHKLYNELIDKLSGNNHKKWVPKHQLPKCLYRFTHMISAGELCDLAEKTNILTFYGQLDSHFLQIQATRSTENELVIVVSNDLITTRLLEIYKKRWSIECLFGNLKTKGFNFEDTHFTKKERLGNLTKLLALAFAIALLLGIIKSMRTPIIIKTHGRREHSYFRYGYDLLITMVLNDLQSVVRLIQLCFVAADWNQRIKIVQKELRRVK